MSSQSFFFIFIPILTLILLAINFIFAKRNPNKEKISMFECGFHSFSDQNRKEVEISYFIFGLVFLLFDIELLLVYPFIPAQNNVYGFGFITLLIFLLILTIGFFYEFGKNALSIASRQTRNNILDDSNKNSSNILQATSKLTLATPPKPYPFASQPIESGIFSIFNSIFIKKLKKPSGILLNKRYLTNYPVNSNFTNEEKKQYIVDQILTIFQDIVRNMERKKTWTEEVRESESRPGKLNVYFDLQESAQNKCNSLTERLLEIPATDENMPRIEDFFNRANEYREEYLERIDRIYPDDAGYNDDSGLSGIPSRSPSTISEPQLSLLSSYETSSDSSEEGLNPYYREEGKVENAYSGKIVMEEPENSASETIPKRVDKGKGKAKAEETDETKLLPENKTYEEQLENAFRESRELSSMRASDLYSFHSRPESSSNVVAGPSGTYGLPINASETVAASTASASNEIDAVKSSSKRKQNDSDIKDTENIIEKKSKLDENIKSGVKRKRDDSDTEDNQDRASKKPRIEEKKNNDSNDESSNDSGNDNPSSGISGDSGGSVNPPKNNSGNQDGAGSQSARNSAIDHTISNSSEDSNLSSVDKLKNKSYLYKLWYGNNPTGIMDHLPDRNLEMPSYMDPDDI